MVTILEPFWLQVIGNPLGFAFQESELLQMLHKKLAMEAAMLYYGALSMHHWSLFSKNSMQAQL